MRTAKKHWSCFGWEEPGKRKTSRPCPCTRNAKVHAPLRSQTLIFRHLHQLADLSDSQLLCKAPFTSHFQPCLTREIMLLVEVRLFLSFITPSCTKILIPAIFVEQQVELTNTEIMHRVVIPPPHRTSVGSHPITLKLSLAGSKHCFR